MITRFYSDSPKVDFDSMPELAGFTSEPAGMYVGCPGKHGYLKLVFELDENGKSIMSDKDRRAPLIVQSAMYYDEGMPGIPIVYIQSSGGPNVDGDRFWQEFILKKGSMAHISTGAATKISVMKSNYSGMKQIIRLEEGSYLEYLPEPVIPARDARYISDTTIEIAPSATLFYSEIYMPGRKYYNEGELFEYDVLSICAHAARLDGEKLFREKFVITPKTGHIRDLGIMGRFDVFANVIVLTPPEQAEKIYNEVEPFWEETRAQGITYLPNQAGLLFKALSMEPGPAKKMAREFCGIVRMAVKGHPLPPEFPWR